MFRRVLVTVLALGACDPLTEVAIGGADFAGAKADAYCDRRFVDGDGQPAGFCQEIQSTVAAAEFADDCRSKHRATAGAGLCPRADVIAGCRVLEEHDDDSKVIDWYYDVSGLTRGDAGGFKNVATSVSEVRALCADAARYEYGAELIEP